MKLPPYGTPARLPFIITKLVAQSAIRGIHIAIDDGVAPNDAVARVVAYLVRSKRPSKQDRYLLALLRESWPEEIHSLFPTMFTEGSVDDG